MKIIKLRKKDKKNFIFLLNLRNKRYVRINSLDKKVISDKNHNIWLNSFFKKKDNKIFIIKKANKNIGYIRLQRKRDINVVSWALLKEYKGKKITSKALKKVTKSYKIKFVAYIKRNNFASIKVAENAGFQLHAKNKQLVTMNK